MTIVLAAIAALILIAMLEWGLRLRAQRGPDVETRGEPGVRGFFTANAFLRKWWSYMVPAGLLLIGIGIALRVPQTGESIYTFGAIMTLLGIRGGIAAAISRKDRR
jgi:hypothetical protein